MNISSNSLWNFSRLEVKSARLWLSPEERDLSIVSQRKIRRRWSMMGVTGTNRRW